VGKEVEVTGKPAARGSRNKRMSNCIAQRHKDTKKRNIPVFLNFFVASWLCAWQFGQVIDKPTAWGSRNKRMSNCIAQRHKDTKKRNIPVFLNFFVASWLCAWQFGQVIDKPAARGGAGVRKQGSGFSAPGINNEVTYENARIDKARDKVRDKVFPEPWTPNPDPQVTGKN
jgi:hypothetical protein